jgi:hypothetical protein
MRMQAAAILLFAAMSSAHAQCPIGSYPTTNGDGQIICKSPGGQRPPESGISGRIVRCPDGTTEGADQWGNRTCSSLAEQASVPAEEAPKPKKPGRKKFEISKKCPQCK